MLSFTKNKHRSFNIYREKSMGIPTFFKSWEQNEWHLSDFCISLLHFLEQLMSMFLKIYAKLFTPVLWYPFRKEMICQSSRWTSVGEGCWANTEPAYVWGKGKVEQGEIVPSVQFTKNRIFANHTYPNCSLSQFYLSYYLYDSQGCYLLTIWSWAHLLTFLFLSFFIHEMGIIIVPTFLG